MTVQEIQRYPYVDSLRGIAILMVVAVHAAQIVFHPGLYASIFSKGAYGVQLFFIVSSLTLFLSYEQRKIVDGKNVAKFFFIRRFFRIAPAFYVAICLYTVAYFLKNHILLGYYGSIDLPQLLLFASFLGVLYPPSMYILPFGGWTVQVEMFFYTLIPFLFKVLSTLKRAVLFFIFSWLGYYVVEQTLLHNNLNSYTPLLLPLAQIPVFTIGIILFHIIKDKKNIIRSPYLFFSTLVIYTCLALYLTKVSTLIPEPLAFSLFFGGLVLLMSHSYIPLLQNKLTAFFGEVSYSLYLFHFAIILFFWYTYRATSHFWNTPPLISFLIIYFLTISIGGFISKASYTYIEKNGINFGKKLIRKYTR